MDQPEQRVPADVLRDPLPPDAQPFVHHVQQHKVLCRAEVLPLEQPLPGVVRVEHPLLVLPLRLKEQMGRLIELVQLPPKSQLPPPPKQPFVFPPQPPLAGPLRVRDENRWPFDEAHQEREQWVRLL